MNAPLPQPLVTAEELLSLPDSDRFELVDGRLVERNVGAFSNYLAGQLFTRLQVYCDAHGIGWVFPPETTFQCFPRRPNVVRKPNTAFVPFGRLPDETVPDGHIRVVPDLAVEVVSPNDLYYEVEEKIAEYRAAGVRLVWVLNPPTRTVLIRRLDGTAAEVGEGGELDGENVVPGFRCPVRDLYQRPGLPPDSPPPISQPS